MTPHRMRRAEKLVSDPAWIEGLLARARVCRIGLCDGDQPYIVPMSFGYEKGRLYLHCAREGRKIDCIRANNRACFEVDEDFTYEPDPARPCTSPTSYKSVVGFGRIHIIELPAEQVHGLDVIVRHYENAGQPYPEAMLERTCVLRLDIEEMAGKASPPPR